MTRKIVFISVVSLLLLGAALVWIPRGPALPPGLTLAQGQNFGSTNLASPGPIGATTPSTGSFTSLTASGNVIMGNASLLLWSTASIQQLSSGVLQVGDTSTDSNSSMRMASLQVGGTKFTASGCANTTTAGGATAGQYVSVTGGTCSITITMGNTATAPNGWSCTANDITTAGDAGNIHQTGGSPTTAILTEGTVVASDVINFACVGY